MQDSLNLFMDKIGMVIFKGTVALLVLNVISQTGKWLGWW